MPVIFMILNFPGLKDPKFNFFSHNSVAMYSLCTFTGKDWHCLLFEWKCFEPATLMHKYTSTLVALVESLSSYCEFDGTGFHFSTGRTFVHFLFSIWDLQIWSKLQVWPSYENLYIQYVSIILSWCSSCSTIVGVIIRKCHIKFVIRWACWSRLHKAQTAFTARD